MTGKDILLDFVFGTEAMLDHRGWDAPPRLLVMRRHADGIIATDTTVLHGVADIQGHLDNLVVSTAINSDARRRFRTAVGPNALGLCLHLEAWGLFDSTSVAEAARIAGPRPVSRHPKRQDVRVLTAVVLGRDVSVQRIRGGEPTVLFDSADAAFDKRLVGHIPEALRALHNIVHDLA
ncbi:hypothetical protein AB0B66_10520 [Catellatospora sp. NPDC049111]|uniref:hypothetical protein n=1 Tax=Catellatospora sp. NPDC049111 TaxID=3155271 RepID=UPI0033C9AE56